MPSIPALPARSSPPVPTFEEPCGDRVETGGGLGGPGILARLQDQSPVVVVADPRVDAGAAVLQPVGIDARVFERPPARHQNQPLLRVQQVRLDRRDAKEGGVEPVDTVEIGAVAAGVDLPRVVGEQRAHAPEAGPRNALLHRVLTGVQQTPEGADVVRAGEAAGHADDGDGGAGFGALRRAGLGGSVRFLVRTAGPV